MAMGTGICGFLSWTPEEQAEVERQLEIDRKREEAEAQRAAERTAEIENTCDSVDKTFSWVLRNELTTENKVARISRAAQQDFTAFQKCCAEWGLPALPAPPQAVVLFLAQEPETT